jgi:ribonuclease Z
MADMLPGSSLVRQAFQAIAAAAACILVPELQARERGHIHITDLVMHAHKFHNEALLLVHFSPRYKRADILAALDTFLPPSLRSRCFPFLNGFA